MASARRFVPVLLLAVAQIAAPLATGADVVYLSDRPELVLSTTQDWGVLGWDAAAHLPDRAGEPLRVGETTYAKGLGSHANGSIQVLLDGDYDVFRAEVGLQPCAGGGSVVFRVRVDGGVRFDSGGVRAGDGAKPVEIPVTGAQELMLEARDAGDGITCDMANWADARLVPAAVPSADAVEPPVDITPFGRIVAWDATRMDGTRASRIEEFPAEELFLETDLRAENDRDFAAPATNGLACIGVQWLNRRAVKELSLTFLDAAQVPPTHQVRIEAWFGESAWQGKWLPLAGELKREDSTLLFSASAKSPVGRLFQTRKVRWVWPTTADRAALRRPVVFTRSRWVTTQLLVQFERPRRVPDGVDEARGEVGGKLIEIFNGEFLEPPRLTRTESRPQALTVRYSRPSSFKSDPTLLRLSLSWDRVTVAVQDIIDNEAVYLPEFGAFFCRADKPITLADYKAKIAGRKTILEQVRELPDQILAQAMAKTHHEAQRAGPVMLSLACDNTKYVVERDGTVRFRTEPHTGTDWFAGAGELRFDLSAGGPEELSRHLDGGWLPIPVITRKRGDVGFRQRSYVAPCDEPGPNPTRFNRLSACMVEFNLTGSSSPNAASVLRLSFVAPPPDKGGFKLEPSAHGFLARHGDQPIAVVVPRQGRAGRVAVDGASLVFDGSSSQAGGVGGIVYLLPPRFPVDQVGNLPAPDRLRMEVESYWRAVLAPAAQIETPEPFLNDLIRSSQVRCLIAARNEADGARIAPWIAAMSYGPLESEAHSVIRGMDFLGHHEFARRGLDYFVHRYNTNGFLTTGYTTFGTAWHLWSLGEHRQLTRDTNWLRQVAPEVKPVGRWIITQTEKTKRDRGFGLTADGTRAAGRPQPDRPSWTPGGVSEYGLMPPGVMADWNAYAYHFCLNAYYAAGLRGISELLTSIGDPDAARFGAAGQSLARATADSFRLTRALAPAVRLRNGTWVPYYPSQVHSPGQLADFFPGEDAGRSWCYDVELGAHQLVPTGVLAPSDEAVEPMLNHLEDVQFLADGWFDYPAAENARDWFNLGGFSKVQPYYTRNCEIYALRDDVKPFVRSYFNTLAAMVNPEVMTFWEHFNHSGAWDKTHETGYFLHQTRILLVQERGDELWLAPMIPSDWLKDGCRLIVSDAPTRFGRVGFRLESHLAQGWIDGGIQAPTDRPFQKIVLRLRQPEAGPISAVTVNGERHRDFDATLVRITPRAGTLRVRAEFRR